LTSWRAEDYWCAPAQQRVVGPYSASKTFNVGPEVVIQAPALTSPGNGGNLSSKGTLTTANAVRSGPAGAISYRFEVATASNFSSSVLTKTEGEGGGGQTSALMDANLTSQATYFWRVTAIDSTNAVSSPASSVFSFKYVPFDMRDAVIVNSPQDLGSWQENARITSINFSPDAFEVEFDRRDGPGRWPDMTPAGGTVPFSTLGLCAQVNGPQWYCRASSVLVRTVAA
jgi:hypothetical protein